MRALIASFSFPWYINTGFGFVVGLVLWHDGFRGEFDALAAHILGMKPRRKGGKHDTGD